MPRLRNQYGPIVQCAFVYCENNFRKWRRRLYCSDRCRKQAWKVDHRPYYAELRKEAWEKQKKANARNRPYRWVVKGREDEAPERLSISEAIAQASPGAIEQIKDILGPDIGDNCE